MRDQSFGNLELYSYLRLLVLTAKKIVTDLITFDNISKDPFYLYVNSPGGEVSSGFSIFDTIRYIDAPAKIVNTGLYEYCYDYWRCSQKENRLTMPNARF